MTVTTCQLRHFQTLFSRSVMGEADLGEADLAIAQMIKMEQRPSVPQRLAVYKNNVYHSLIEALADTYPVIQQLVGKDFFAATAKDYISQFPPSSAVLLEFGGQFSDFLASFEPAAALPYLCDLAKLEYAWQESYHERDCQSLSVDDFASIPADSLYQQSLVCHPSLQLLHSPFAVGSIWQAHQHSEGLSEELRVDQQEWLAVVRPQYQVQVCFLDEPGFKFVQYLKAGRALGEVVDEIAMSFPQWQISETLAFAIQQGFFSDVRTK